MIQQAACAFAEAWTSINRKPLAILLFAPATAGFIAIGAAIGQTQLFLLIVTTVLSVDASLSSRMVMLRQAQDAGEEDRPQS